MLSENIVKVLLTSLMLLKFCVAINNISFCLLFFSSLEQLEKINKIVEKQIGEGISYESLLVIDGTTGQNGLTQARVFNEVTHLTGFVVTKLDGTAKGGIIFAISEELKKPIKYIGVGEGINDLQAFNKMEFVDSFFKRNN